ncbi:sensor histidine kinase [Snuella sedimenti]|uniref:histidine kinase n=1 Tax=Snuella sedimenti TaxID=2798802 RepID=A0A8J7LYK8_9FLAO|nr:ATP-binding protein [Snuella sedimenti]MBJ6368546.1 histidine kinase [Snuella sedimenti]
MSSKALYFKIIFRVVFILATSIGFAFSILQNHLDYAIYLGIILIAQVIGLIAFLNQTNKKIAFFFEAIENDDSTVHYPIHIKNKSLKALHDSLNKVNNLIQGIKIEHEAQERYYQTILEEAAIGILTINKHGHIYTANKSAKAMLSRNQLTHVRQLQQINKKLHDLIAGLKPFDPKLFQFTNEREIIKLSVKATPLVLNKKELLLVLIQNINSEIEQNEVDSWNKLFSVLTHEIMNTIAPITSLSETLVDTINKHSSTNNEQLMDASVSKNISKGLNVIKQNSHNLVDFVNSYRTLTKIPSPDKNILSVESLFDKIKILCSQEKGFSNVTFKTNISNDLEIFADEKQVLQVLVNLVKNALQSIGDNTNGVIKLIGTKGYNGKIVLQVADNGPGIPSDLLSDIFVPFFTTKKEGTGIGLSLSKHIMRLHGGSLRVSSVPEKETVFTLSF